MHQLYACAELNGYKVNLELLFMKKPNMQQFVTAAEEHFNSEISVTKDIDEGNVFRVYRVSVFDSALKTWIELVSESQLTDFTQVYIFQEQGGPKKRAESIQDLPCPKPITLHLHMPKRPIPVP